MLCRTSKTLLSACDAPPMAEFKAAPCMPHRFGMRSIALQQCSPPDLPGAYLSMTARPGSMLREACPARSCAVLVRGLSEEEKAADRLAVRSSPNFATILDFLEVHLGPVINYELAMYWLLLNCVFRVCCTPIGFAFRAVLLAFIAQLHRCSLLDVDSASDTLRNCSTLNKFARMFMRCCCFGEMSRPLLKLSCCFSIAELESVPVLSMFLDMYQKLDSTHARHRRCSGRC